MQDPVPTPISEILFQVAAKVQQLEALHEKQQAALKDSKSTKPHLTAADAKKAAAHLQRSLVLQSGRLRRLFETYELMDKAIEERDRSLQLMAQALEQAGEI